MIQILTGHLYIGSAWETSDSCGNCDGARCDHCEERWETADGVRFDSLGGAEAHENERKAALAELVPGYSINEYCEPEFWLQDEVLVARWYKHDEEESKRATERCNEASPLYYGLWRKAVDEAEMYASCSCHDKAGPHYGNSCDVFKACNDSACYHEMKYCNRREKKWYM